MKKLISLLALTFMCSGLVYGQERAISGTVVDTQGDPVVGVSVIVVGSDVGTISDAKGEFSISVPSESSMLEFSFITMKEVTLPAKNGMRVTMELKAKELDAVFTVGYSSTTKTSYVGSAAVVTSETIEKKNPSDVTKSLAGEFAGVRVITTSGQPGTSATIRIRGIGSVNSSNAPLYVVDGVPYFGDDLSAIDPGDVASTTVLKDATATALYGSRGANGVILITTKKGTAGAEGKIDVDVKYGLNARLVPLHEAVTSPERYTELGWQGMYTRNLLTLGHQGAVDYANGNLFSNKGVNPYYNLWDVPGNALIDGETGKFYPDVARRYTPESWTDHIFHTGQKMEATLKMHGGSDKTTYYASFGYLKDEGYYIQSDFNRLTARSNIDFQPKKWLKGNVNLSYAYSEMNNPGQTESMNNGFQYVNGMPPIFPVFQHDPVTGEVVKDAVLGGNAYDYGMYENFGRPFGPGINPAGALQLDRQISRAHDLSVTTRMEVEFAKNLTLAVNVAYQFYGGGRSDMDNLYYGDAAGIGRVIKISGTLDMLTANQILNYKKTFGDVHNFDAFIAHETGSSNYSYQYGSKSELVTSTLEWSRAALNNRMESYTQRRTMESYFGQARYNYNERYFFHGTVRADGSSRFASGHRWGTFGSAGVAWLLSSEGFMSDTKSWLKVLKVKASLGTTGNSEIGDDRYHDLYSLTVVDGLPALYWASFGNPDITWEKSTLLNTGIEFELSKYLTGEIEYFYKYTHDMLFQRYVAPSQGFQAYYENGGAMTNQGVEVQLKAHAIDTRSVKLDIHLNGGHYSNRIVKMPMETETKEMIRNGSMVLNHSLWDWSLREFLGVNPQNGMSQYKAYYTESRIKDNPQTGRKDTTFITDVYLFQQENPNEEIKTTVTEDYASAGLNYTGKSANPTIYGGFGIDLSLYGIDFSASFSYQLGGYGYDNNYAGMMHSDVFGTYSWHQDIERAWKKPGDVTDVPRLSNGLDQNANSASTRFLTSNSFLQLANVRLGYSLPKKWIEKVKLNNFNVWVSGDNLFSLTARKGFAPFAAFDGSNDRSQYVPLSTIMCGIKFQF
ncbi:MAG: SusC/RagA family TonB-linked outer membrane protein [Prevotellaceae bacterium]|jgi:TonB-linked SusC/RagA family outer membrane protein|nr:SusC/RagA family TonB-linked outer membrane protein [Prevotellaceae bacterium]